MRSCWIRVGTKSHDWCPCKKRRDTYRCREGGRVTKEVEVRVTEQQSKEHQGLPAAPEAGREAWTRCSRRALGGHQACPHLDLDSGP